LDPELAEGLKAGQPRVEITAALAYKRAPNNKCPDFFDHYGQHVFEVVKHPGMDLYHNGPTTTLENATKNRELVDQVLAVTPEEFDAKRLHTATFKQIAEDIADFVDASVRRQAAVGDPEALNRSAVHDISEGLAVLLRGLRNLTNNDELVDLRDDPPPEDDE